jgi:excisionase family DNA binding protein
LPELATETNEIMSANNSSEQTLPVPLVYTVEEAAAALNCSTKTVRRLISRGYLCPSSALRKKIIPRQQVHDFLKATCDTPLPQAK